MPLVCAMAMRFAFDGGIIGTACSSTSQASMPPRLLIA